MYKVMFVDDEEQNLFLMEMIIDWEDHNFRVSGMALDGIEGVKMYQEVKPDLMFVDIRMEEMDGLSLIESIKEKEPETSTVFVIVTAYEEFSYAQKAIRLGVENYILKPLDRAELSTLVSDIQKKLDEKNQKEKILQLQEKQQGNFIYEKVIRSLDEEFMKNKTDITLQYDLNKVIGGRIYYPVSIFAADAAMEELQELIEKWEIVHYYPQYDSILIIAEKVKREEMQRRFNKEYLMQSRRKYFLQYGREFHDEKSFVSSLWEMYQTRHFFFYATESASFDSTEKLEGGVFQEKDSVEIKADELLKELLYTGKTEKVLRELKHFITEASERMEEPDKLIDDMVDILFLLKHQLTQIYKDRAFMLLRHMDIWKLHKVHTSWRLYEEMHKILSDIGRAVLGMIENKENYSMMGKILEYTAHNYDRSDFSATEAAEAVNLSRNYFLKIFKEENGISFWDYVTKLRMDRAKQLLKNTNETVYAISTEIGYESQYHFSRKFKAMFNMSPVEYRNL